MQHLPLPVVVVQREVHHAQVVAPAPRHDGRHTVDRAACDVYTGVVSKCLARKFCMGMAQQNGVHAGNLRQARSDVFSERTDLALFKAGVGNHHHQLCTFAAHLGDVALGHLHHIACRHAAFEVAFVPLHDLWGYQA